MSINNINSNPLFKQTSAGQIALKLDAADGKVDGKIDKSIWNKFVNDKGGKQIKNSISTENAMKSITSYAVRNATTDKKADDIGNEWLKVASNQTVVDTVKQDSIKQGEEINTKFSQMSDKTSPTLINDKVELEIMDDAWRQKYSDTSISKEERNGLFSQYYEKIKEMGTAFLTYIDNTFGNGDGKLDKDEYKKYEAESAQIYEVSGQELEQHATTGFNHLDMNKDKSIDEKEMAAYLYAMDFNTKDGERVDINGKISAYDFMVNSLGLAKENSNIDAKMKHTFGRLFPNE